MVLKYSRVKFDRMERGEHHKAMKSFVRKEELGENHFSKKKSAKEMLRYN